MMIQAKYQNLDIKTGTQGSVNTLNAVRCNMGIYNRDYKAVTNTKGHWNLCLHLGTVLQAQCRWLVKLLENVVKFWHKQVAAGRPYMWEQDLTAWHTSGKGQEWLSDNFYKLNSPNF